MVKLPRRDSIPIIYIIRAFRILLLHDSIIKLNELATDREILSACGRIFSSEWMGQAFIYLCRTGATTAWLLQVQLGMPETTSHRVLKRLMTLEIVEPVIKIPRRKLRRSGPIPKVWGLRGHYGDEDVAKAINLHYRTLSPKYRMAREIAQSMLSEYIRPRHVKEISYKDIVAYVREMRRVPFHSPDLADLAATYIHEQGIKVWR